MWMTSASTSRRTSSSYYSGPVQARGYVTTASDELGRKTVMELVSDIPRPPVPGGPPGQGQRGAAAHDQRRCLCTGSYPSVGISKLYRVTVQPRADEAQIIKMSSGVVLDDGTKTLPCAINVIGHR